MSTEYIAQLFFGTEASDLDDPEAFAVQHGLAVVQIGSAWTGDYQTFIAVEDPISSEGYGAASIDIPSYDDDQVFAWQALAKEAGLDPFKWQLGIDVI